MHISRHLVEYLIAGTTLAASAFVAYGPYRHRLPKIMTRFAKLGIAFKLAVMSVLAGLGVYHSATNDGRLIVQVMLGLLCIAFAVAAGSVAFWKSTAPVQTAPEPPAAIESEEKK